MSQLEGPADRDRDRDGDDSLTAEQQSELDRARRSARAVGLYLPLAIVALGLLIQLVWLPRMPDPVAVHWGLSGEPDGFGPVWTNLVSFSASSLVVIALYLLMGLQGLRLGAPAWSSMSRFLPAMILGTVVLVQVMAIGSSWSLLDVADARDGGSILGALILGPVLGIAAGVVAWFAQPKVVIAPGGRRPSTPLPLAGDERAVWIAAVRPSKPLIAVLGLGVFALAISAALAGPSSGFVLWLNLAIMVVIVVGSLLTMWFRVRVDEAGIEARSPLGWPVFRVAAGDVDQVTARRVVPVAEFGGWGLRWVPGIGFGIVMRTGEGVVVTRKDGKIWAVTVDDAETGAKLLAAAAERWNETGE